MKKKTTTALIVLSYIAFISLGLPDGLLGVAWPGIRNSFNLPLDAMGLLLIFSTAGYMVSSFFSGALVRRLGIGGLLSLSCGATATALMIYSITPLWGLFVIAASLGGLGAGAIDAGINTYVEKNHSERMMQWLHASFGIGITLGPVIMTLGISLTTKWQVGYFMVSIAQATLAIIFFTTRKMWKAATTGETEKHHVAGEASIGETLKKLSALLSMLMFFIYTGVELGLGLWAYSLLTISRHVDPAIAGFITGSYWAMFTFGRILAGWYTHKLSVKTILYISLISAMTGALLVSLNLGDGMTIAGIAIIGFSIAPIFPSLITDTGNRVGPRHVSNTIGMQIAAAGFGAAVVPSIAGVLARIYSLEIIPLYLLTALVLLFLCFTLSHPRSLKKSSS
ncbi:MAG: MFS transporter [Spirochaetaceae bacterium]|nr:MFS transporter [Spirochaetaceae bacterium]